MTDPTLHSAFCATIERSIALALRYDPASQLALEKLSGNILAVEFSQPNLTFYFVLSNDGVTVQSYCEGSITTRLKGSPLALVSLAKSTRLNLSDSGVEVFGSTGLLIEAQTILNNFEIDWEQALSDRLGDIVGHETAKAIRTTLGWSKQRGKTLKRLLGEYLSEELRAVPSKVETKYFMNDVDSLRLGADRISAKVAQLKQRISTI